MKPHRARPSRLSLAIVSLTLLGTQLAFPAYGLEPKAETPASIYGQLHAFSLGYGALHAQHIVLKKDRVVLTFENGTFYFSAPVAGKVRSAVYLGEGIFHADVPPSDFEKENVRRLLKGDSVDSDFKTAVLKFTDDTFTELGTASLSQGQTPDQAKKLADELENRVLEETGANLSARQLISILNRESPGFFFAQVAGGHRGRFNFLLDYQARIPVANFDINAGERGLIFASDLDFGEPDIWMAFYTEGDYKTGRAQYSDQDDLIETPKYTMNVDVTEPKKWLRLTARLDCVSRTDGLLAIPFAVGENLSHDDNQRKKKQLHVVSVVSGREEALSFFQEPWEGGFTVVLPETLNKAQPITLKISLSGEFMKEAENVSETYFPLRTTTWFPRHGYLQRSVFDVEFRHRKRDSVASIGTLVHEGDVPGVKDERTTEFRLDHAIALISFGVAPYEVHKDVAKMNSGQILPIEFYSMPGRLVGIKEDFVLAELNNCVRYFSALFGDYPYPVFRAAFHPFGFGQGFPTMLMIPGTDKATMYTYQFIAHETSHQWWGDSVLWRSYSDQWLSEGFAEYSGLLYTGFRDRASGERELIERSRRHLKSPPETLRGIGKGRLVDIGPLIMGHRLETRESGGAYSTLIYDKGGLVLRMLHFLFTDPQTGDGKAFFDMMRDFVDRYKGKAASTDDFFAVVNAHVPQTALAQRYGYKDLHWFYVEWVLQNHLPSYRLTYALDAQPDGSVLLSGTLAQDGIPDSEQWFMPMPVVVTLSKGKKGIVPVAVRGKESPVKIRLPSRPEKVELDPDLWILSEKTSTERR